MEGGKECLIILIEWLKTWLKQSWKIIGRVLNLLPMQYMTRVMFIYSIILNSVTIHHVHIIFLKWDTEFTADTIIMYEEYPTAIVNMDYYKEYEDLFSMLVHELFHGYQYIKDEKTVSR
ncbi:hypothetical protein RCO48_23710 [Peribacillus frigoritolerans]|nr:hypothetical protein [Peribacillus frigoritolerans]